MNWHNEIHREMGWFEELRKRKIENRDICGGCNEWPEFCSCCYASISDNEPHSECDRIEGRDQDGGG